MKEKHIVRGGGSVGDAYIILCKLYDTIKSDPMLVLEHHEPISSYTGMIREVFQLTPTMNYQIINSKAPVGSLHGLLSKNNAKELREDFRYDVQYFPSFIYHEHAIELPERYEVVQLKSGRNDQPRIVSEEKIMVDPDMCQVLVGTDSIKYNPKGCRRIIDTRGKLTLMQTMSLIRGAEHFHGFIGVLGYFAVSHRVNSTIFVNKMYDGHEYRLKDNPWGVYAKVVKI